VAYINEDTVMPTTKTLSRLWSRQELPIHDGLYLADGRAWSMELDQEAPGGLRVTEPFDVDAFLAENSEWVTSFAISKEVELPAGAGRLYCGEGSWGSEGILGRLSPSAEPVWAVYLERSNPFVDIETRGTLARFHSSSDVRISVDLARTEFALATWPAQ
jgi:hypothetical protein